MSHEERLSRREFLKTFAGGALFLSQFSLPKEALAELQETITGRESKQENFESVLKRLKDAVWENRNEVFLAHIKKGALEMSLDVSDRADESSAHKIDLTPLFKDASVERIYLAHSHPAHQLEERHGISQEEMERVMKEKKSALPLLPSGDDIGEYIDDARSLREVEIQREFRYFVVEPSGVWSYTVDLEHPRIRRLFSSSEKYHPMSDVPKKSRLGRLKLNEELSLQEAQMHEEGGMSEESLTRFKVWAKQNWGIAFEYQRYDL